MECTGVSDYGRNRFMYSTYGHINVHILENDEYIVYRRAHVKRIKRNFTP
jgi:hypothetical protein